MSDPKARLAGGGRLIQELLSVLDKSRQGTRARRPDLLGAVLSSAEAARLADHIDELATARETIARLDILANGSRWIPFDVRMPGRRETVLLSKKPTSSMPGYVEMGWLDESGESFDNHDWNCPQPVSAFDAWQPMPAPVSIAAAPAQYGPSPLLAAKEAYEQMTAAHRRIAANGEG